MSNVRYLSGANMQHSFSHEMLVSHKTLNLTIDLVISQNGTLNLTSSFRSTVAVTPQGKSPNFYYRRGERDGNGKLWLSYQLILRYATVISWSVPNPNHLPLQLIINLGAPNVVINATTGGVHLSKSYKCVGPSWKNH